MYKVAGNIFRFTVLLYICLGQEGIMHIFSQHLDPYLHFCTYGLPLLLLCQQVSRFFSIRDPNPPGKFDPCPMHRNLVKYSTGIVKKKTKVLYTFNTDKVFVKISVEWSPKEIWTKIDFHIGCTGSPMIFVPGSCTSSLLYRLYSVVVECPLRVQEV